MAKTSATTPIDAGSYTRSVGRQHGLNSVPSISVMPATKRSSKNASERSAYMAVPTKPGPTFPNILLTCLQNHFLHRAETIYEQYKHVRYSIEILLQKLPQLQQNKTQEEMIDVLSQAHFITKPVRRAKSKKRLPINSVLISRCSKFRATSKSLSRNEWLAHVFNATKQLEKIRQL